MAWTYWLRCDGREELQGPFSTHAEALESRLMDEEDQEQCSGIYYCNPQGTQNARFGGDPLLDHGSSFARPDQAPDRPLPG